MSAKKLLGWQDWATFRFAVIGGLLTRPPEKGELQKALSALAEQSYQHPAEPQKKIRLSFATIERWYYQAQAAPDPIAVLGRKPRVDAGRRPSISERLLEAIKTQYHAHPRWSVQLHYDNLSALARERPDLTPLPSDKSLLRLMRENGWRRRGGARAADGRPTARPQTPRRAGDQKLRGLPCACPLAPGLPSGQDPPAH